MTGYLTAIKCTSASGGQTPSVSDNGTARTLAGLMVLLIALSHQAFADNESDYSLDSGDVINIRVLREPDLSFQKVRLTDSGSFSYPFLGEINARGLTTVQVEERIVEGLAGDYLVDPKVSVSIVEYREFFVNGYVKSPGGYPFKPGLTVQKAIALAGGLTERASDDRVEIIRERDGEKEKFSAKLQTPVLPGDILTIEQRFF